MSAYIPGELELIAFGLFSVYGVGCYWWGRHKSKRDPERKNWRKL